MSALSAITWFCTLAFIVISPRGLLRISQRLQPGLDLRAPRLQERRQRQPLAELFQRLVGGEARPVGRDLEQDAVRLAEIETAEIVAVDLAAVRDVHGGEPLRPAVVLCLVGCAEGD